MSYYRGTHVWLNLSIHPESASIQVLHHYESLHFRLWIKREITYEVFGGGRATAPEQYSGSIFVRQRVLASHSNKPVYHNVG